MSRVCTVEVEQAMVRFAGVLDATVKAHGGESKTLTFESQGFKDQIVEDEVSGLHCGLAT
jgi:hypothetical protein